MSVTLIAFGIQSMSLMASTDENPLLTPQNTPYGVPAFDKVKVEHYLPAFDKAIAENEAEVVAIANNASHDWLLCMQKALYDLQIQWNMPIEIGGGYGAMAAESVVRMVQLQYDMAGELPVERSTPLSANRKDNIN